MYCYIAKHESNDILFSFASVHRFYRRLTLSSWHITTSLRYGYLICLKHEFSDYCFVFGRSVVYYYTNVPIFTRNIVFRQNIYFVLYSTRFSILSIVSLSVNCKNSAELSTTSRKKFLTAHWSYVTDLLSSFKCQV